MSMQRSGTAAPGTKIAAFFKVMSTWFGTAVLVGTTALIVAPRTGAWLDPSIAALKAEYLANEPIHRCCYFEETLTHENKLPSTSVYIMYTNQDMQWHTCTVGKDTPHCKDDDDIEGKSYPAAARLKVDIAMTQYLIAHVMQDWPSGKPAQKHVFLCDQFFQKTRGDTPLKMHCERKKRRKPTRQLASSRHDDHFTSRTTMMT